MHQSRHHAVGIELAVGRIVLIAAQCQQVLLNLKTLFSKCYPHFLRTNRIDVVIMFEHARPPECCLFAVLEHEPDKWIMLKTILVWMAAEVE